MTAKQLIISLEKMVENFGDQEVELPGGEVVRRVYYENAETENELPAIVIT